MSKIVVEPLYSFLLLPSEYHREEVEKEKKVSEGLVLLLLRVPNAIDLRAEPAVRSRFEGNSSILGSTLWGLKGTLGAYPQGSGGFS